MRKPKITVIGGGTGIPVILNSLRHEEVDVTATVTVVDDSSSSGTLRSVMQLTPPGDLRNVLVAMSDMPKFYEKVFQYHFAETDGILAGYPFGNSIISGVAEMQGSTYNAMQLLTKFFHVIGKIYPTSENPLTLYAVFKDGHKVISEGHIADYKGMINHVYVTNTYNNEEPTASRKVVDAIMDSDMIVLGPGSLFTPILPNLVIPEIRKALLEAPTEVACVCNIMTQCGETEHFTDADHVEVLNRHLGKDVIDTILVNIQKIPQDYMNSNEFNEYLVQVEHDFARPHKQVKRVISSDFLRLEDGGAFHNGDSIVEELMNLVRMRKR